MFIIAEKFTYEYVKRYIEKESDSGCKLLSEEYKNSTTKLKIMCKCGDSFEATFTKFKDRNKRQCNSCGRDKGAKSRHGNYNTRTATYEDVSNYISIHGCILLTAENTFGDSEDVLDIQCSCGEVMKLNYKQFKIKRQKMCDKCMQIKKGKNRRLKYEDVKSYIEEESESGCKLISTTYEGVNKLLEIQCECEKTFKASLHKFRNNYKRQCNSCSKTESRHEKTIAKYLKNKDIEFDIEYTFDDCRNPITNAVLRFDFVIFDKDIIKCLIECDGEQHYKPSIFGNYTQEVAEQNLELQKYKDEIKNNYCKQNNIKLIRIPYWDFFNLEEVLGEKLIAEGVI